MIGSTISHYELVAKLGQGGMGVVYRAMDTRLGRVVALKMLLPELVERADLRQRILREARAAALLNHANVCSIYDVDQTLGFLVMECIDGPTLKDVMRRGALTGDRVLEILLQIADGLQAAHARGIVHRDIKPGNILLTTTGQVKITDFGLAKTTDEITVTLTGQVLGTPAYMSPEQVRGETADARSDIWSLGIVLHEMLTGNLPFQSDSIASLLYKIVHDPPEPVAATGAGKLRFLPVLDRCLAKAPNERYQTMSDLCKAIRALGETSRGASTTESIPQNTATMGAERTPSIAVLDFANRSGDAAWDWLSIAIAETLTADLRRIGRLRIVDRRQVLKVSQKLATDAQSSLGETAAELGAECVIHGWFDFSDAGLQVHAGLTDSFSRVMMPEATESGPLEQVFSLLDRIVSQLADALGHQLQHHELQRIERPETKVLDAYRLYARGRRLYYTFNAEKMEEARETFETAIKMDPRYGLSWAGLGTIYTFRYIQSTNERDLEAGIGYLLQAIAVDPDLSEAHTSLAYGYMRQRLFSKGVDAGNRAVELEPASTTAHYFLGVNHLGCALEERRPEHFVLAISEFGESVRLESNYQPGLMMWGWALMLRGEHQEASAHLARASDVERSGRFDVMHMVGAQTLLGYAQYRLGQLGEAEQSFRSSLDNLHAKSHLYRDLFVALTHCGLADIRLEQRRQDEAIEELHNAMASIERNPAGLGMGYCMVRVLTGFSRSFQKLGMARESRDHLSRAIDLFRAKAQYDFHLIWEGSDAQACYDLARACAVVNRREESVRWLEEAVASGWHDRNFLLRDEAMAPVISSLDLDALLSARSTPEFRTPDLEQIKGRNNDPMRSLTASTDTEPQP